MLDGLRRDLGSALRSLRRAPVFTAIAVGTLGLAIGANSAVFSLVNGLLLRPLPVRDPHALVTVSSDEAIALGFNTGLGWTYAMWTRLQQRSQPFDGALALSPQTQNLAQSGERQPAEVLFVSGDFFATLGVAMAMGRSIDATDDVRGGGPAGPVAVISHRLWQRRFDGKPVVGNTLLVEGVPFTIVGVTPPEFEGLEVGRAFDVAVPLGTEPLVHPLRPAIDSPNQFFLTTIMLRLRPGQTVQSATATMRALQPDILGTDRAPRFAKDPFTLVPASTGTSGAQIGVRGMRQQYQHALVAMLAIVGLVLLIACASLANLLIERASARRHELSVQIAIGASRWYLARQMLIESFTLAALGAAAGLLFATWTSRLLVNQLSTGTGTIVLGLALDWRVLGFSAGMTVLTAVLFGSAPAFRATRIAARDVANTLRAVEGVPTARRFGSSVAASLSGTLVIQLALSVVLVVAAGLLTRSFQRLSSVPVGFDARGLLLVYVQPGGTVMTTEERASQYARLVEAVGALPGVARAAGSIATPVEGGGQAAGMKAALAASSSGEENIRILRNAVTPAWFATYGTPVVDGRDIDSRDLAQADPVIVVNRAFARKFSGDRPLVGTAVGGRRVIGVVEDQVIQGGFKEDGQSRSLRDPAPPTVYLPLSQPENLRPPDRTDVIISVRLSPGATSLPGRSLAAAIGRIDPGASFRAAPISDRLDAALAGDRLVAQLAGVFGALVLLLAGLGLYGLTALAAARRRKEFGIRLALGARPSQVLGFVLRQAGLVSALGIGLGLMGAAAVTRYLQALLFGLTPLDAVTFLTVACLFGAITAIGALVPARRAARLDPLVALRKE